jgi:hypothetical protein
MSTFPQPEPRPIERVDYDNIAQRLQTFARRDAALTQIDALSPAEQLAKIDCLAEVAIDKASGWVLNREYPPMPAYARVKLRWLYVAAFSEAKSQMVRWS